MKVYHYTNLNSFEAILKSKSIRFSALSYVNDKYEGETQDIGNVGKYIFVSCWSLRHAENSMMWKMYGDKFRGLRICLDMPIFNLYYDNQNNPSPIPHDGIYEERYLILPAEINKYFIKLTYTDSIIYLKPKTLYEYGNMNGGVFNFGSLGKCKSKIWKYENEYRFIIYTLPMIGKKSFSENPVNAIGESLKLMQNDFNIGIDFLDIKFNEHAFIGMIINSGTSMNERDKDSLYYTVQKYNPSAIIKESSL